MKAELHPSLKATFVPLPSDPSIKLTDDELDALFTQPSALKDVVAIVMQTYAVDDDTQSAGDTHKEQSA